MPLCSKAPTWQFPGLMTCRHSAAAWRPATLNCLGAASLLLGGDCWWDLCCCLSHVEPCLAGGGGPLALRGTTLDSRVLSHSMPASQRPVPHTNGFGAPLAEGQGAVDTQRAGQDSCPYNGWMGPTAVRLWMCAAYMCSHESVGVSLSPCVLDCLVAWVGAQCWGCFTARMGVAETLGCCNLCNSLGGPKFRGF